jgi:hypothetical protein
MTDILWNDGQDDPYSLPLIPRSIGERRDEAQALLPLLIEQGIDEDIPIQYEDDLEDDWDEREWETEELKEFKP